MSDRRDDTMFSFRGLFDLERQPGQQEEAAHIRKVELERLELEQRRRLVGEAQARQEKAEREARRQHELHAREEAARYDALRLAAIERARVEEESRARMAEREQEQVHEKRLLEIRRDDQLRAARRVALAGGAAFLCTLVAGATLYFGKLQPENERLQVAYDRLVAAERARSAEATRLLAQADAKRIALRKENEKLRQLVEQSENAALPPRAASLASSKSATAARAPIKP